MRGSINYKQPSTKRGEAHERGNQPSVLADTTTVSRLRSPPERREAEHSRRMAASNATTIPNEAARRTEHASGT
jgi:hypothetical protein